MNLNREKYPLLPGDKVLLSIKDAGKPAIQFGVVDRINDEGVIILIHSYSSDAWISGLLEAGAKGFEITWDQVREYLKKDSMKIVGSII